MTRRPVLLSAVMFLLVSPGAALSETPPGFVLQWGTTGSGPTNLRRPFVVAASADNHVYVSDSFNYRVQKFTTGGVLVDSWTGVGSPLGIAFGSGGDVYIADSGGDRIRKLTSGGSGILEWGSTGTAPGRFDFPWGIAVNSAGVVLVTDSNNDRVQMFDGSGTFLGQWGSSGTGNGQFNFPAGIAVDGDDKVFVADLENHRIQVFDPSGVFLYKFGFCCAGEGSFNGPSQISIDSGGNVYVADTGHSRIKKFANDGTYRTEWGYYGTGPGEMNYPTGVSVDGSGIVYVADYGNDRIQKFDPAVPPLPPPPPSCDNQPKIMVHVTAPTAKNICSLGVPPSLDQAVVKGATASPSGPFYFVYLLAVRGAVPTLAGLQCGVSYDNNTVNSASNGTGIDVFDWNLCATLQFPEPGWPGPGTGNTITWDKINNCQIGDVAVAGYFYVAAYTADTFRIIPKPADGRSAVATCDSPPQQIDLIPADLGYVAFSPGAVRQGCNPCVANCAAENPIPVENTTWSRIKGLVGR